MLFRSNSTAFSSLNAVGSYITINNCARLTSLPQLHSLISLNNGALTITVWLRLLPSFLLTCALKNNNALTNVDDLYSILNVHSLSITGNSFLKSIAGLCPLRCDVASCRPV